MRIFLFGSQPPLAGGVLQSQLLPLRTAQTFSLSIEMSPLA